MPPPLLHNCCDTSAGWWFRFRCEPQREVIINLWEYIVVSVTPGFFFFFFFCSRPNQTNANSNVVSDSDSNSNSNSNSHSHSHSDADANPCFFAFLRRKRIFGQAVTTLGSMMDAASEAGMRALANERALKNLGVRELNLGSLPDGVKIVNLPNQVGIDMT